MTETNLSSEDCVDVVVKGSRKGEFMMNHVPQADYEAWKQALDKAVIYKKMTDKGYYEKLNEDIKLLEWYSAINIIGSY